MIRTLGVLEVSGAALATLALAVAAIAEPQAARRALQPSVAVVFARDERLVKAVRVSVHGLPLKLVLAQLASSSGVELICSKDLAEYRINADSGNTELRIVMQRLQQVMAHGTLPPKSTVWLNQSIDGQLRYQLVSTRRGREEEAELLNRPAETARRWLSEIRDYSRMTEGERNKAKGDSPVVQEFSRTGASLTEGELGPVGSALSSLSNDQLITLANSGRIAVDSTVLSKSAFQTLASDVGIHPHNYTGPITSGARLELVLEPEDETGINQVMLHVSGSSSGVYGYGMTLDTLGVLSKMDDEPRLDVGPDATVPIDLLPPELRKDGKTPATSLATWLGFLSKQAHVNVYAEVFLKSPRPVPRLKGTTEQLLDAICDSFRCTWRKIDGDYVVWSRTWAQDRAGDVPQELLVRWAEERRAKGRFEFSSLIDMAKLTDRQLTTVNRVLGATVTNVSAPLASLRLLGRLSSTALDRAHSDAGERFIPRSDADQVLLSRLFGRNLEAPIYVRLSQQKKGVAMEWWDQLGNAPIRWAYQVDAPPPEIDQLSPKRRP